MHNKGRYYKYIPICTVFLINLVEPYKTLPPIYVLVYLYCCSPGGRKSQKVKYAFCMCSIKNEKKTLLSAKLPKKSRDPRS